MSIVAVSERRASELREAAEALQKLYDFVGAKRKEEVTVTVKQSDLEIGREFITVVIGGGIYSIRVECDSIPMMIKEVVDATCLKI